MDFKLGSFELPQPWKVPKHLAILQSVSTTIVILK
jgi:hypothetical protein